MTATDVFIVGGVRTPMTEYQGVMKDLSAPELGAIATRAVLERSHVRPEWVDHAIVGHVLHNGGGGIYHARHMGLMAGLPIEVPALGVNRLCGSGLQAAISAAQMMGAGDGDVMLVAGMESMSQAPHALHRLRAGLRLGHTQLEDTLWAALNDSYAGCAMAATAENCAKAYGISREEQDAFAVRSQTLALEAWDEGRLSAEVVPVEVKTSKAMHLIERDDHMRPGTTAATLAKLSPVLSKTGTVTAGNASGIVDGAAALMLASAAAVNERGLNPLGRIVAWAVAGVEPKMMGMGPVPATRGVLKRTALDLADIDLFELNEAFAGQYLAVEKELGLDRERVNVNGGAIALGHPLGMTGVRQLLTLLLELRRRGKSRGIATACIGGGQGIAVLIETVN